VGSLPKGQRRIKLGFGLILRIKIRIKHKRLGRQTATVAMGICDESAVGRSPLFFALGRVQGLIRLPAFNAWRLDGWK